MWTAFARGWRQARRDARRYLLTVIALSFGVALLFGTSIASQAIGAQLASGVNSLGGIGDVGLVPANGADRVAARAQAEVAALPGVGLSIGTLTVDSSVRGPSGASVDLSVTGYPGEYNSRLGGLVDQGRLPARGRKEVLLPTDVAQRLSASVGDSVTVAAYQGAERLVVVGTVPPTRLGALAYDNVFVDLGTASDLFALPGQLTRVDVMLGPGWNVGRWEAANSGRLPGTLQLQDTSALTSTFGPLLSVISLILFTASGVTLAVATMLAATAFTESVRSRGDVYGALRAVGATGRWLARGVLAEAMLLAVAAAALGLPLGLATSAGLTGLLTSVGDLPQGPVEIDAWQVLLAVGAALLGALAGASRAVITVLRQAPMTTLVPVTAAVRRRAVVPLLVGSGLLIVGLVAGLLGGTGMQLVAFGLLLAGAAAVAPASVTLLAWVVRRAGPARWPLAVAADRLARLRPLSAVAAAAAIVVALSAALAVGVDAISTAMQTQLARQFGADVQVSSRIPTGADIAGRISRVPGVSRVTSTLADEVVLETRGGSVAMSFLAVDPMTYFATAQLPWRDGDDRTTPAAMRGEASAAVLPEALAAAEGLRVGTTVRLVRGSASARVRVVGTYASLSTGNQVVITRAVAARLGATGSNGWNAAAATGQSAGATRDRVAAALDDIPGLEIVTAAEMRERATAQLASYAAAAFAIVVVTLVLGAAGAGGLLALSTARREREIGTLRALGASTGRIRRMVLWEVAIVATAATIVGLITGQLAGLVLIRIIGGALGATLDASAAPLAFLGIALLTTFALLLSALAPSRRATRVDPVQALASL